jgi:acyl carrier protein
MQDRKIEERVISGIAKGCRHKNIPVDISTTFDSLDIDSADRLQILFELEEEFQIVIPDRVARRATSVKDVIEKLKAAIESDELS